MSKTQTRSRHTPAFVWGYNNSGGLGLGHSARAYQPVPTYLPEGTIDVQGGGEFTVACTASGEVYAWGGNVYGQLGDGTTKSRRAWTRVELPPRTVITAIQAGTDHVLALTKRGEVYGWGRNHRGQVGVSSTDHQYTPQLVIDGGIKAVAAGNAISVAIASKGDLLTWGRNGAKQLAIGSAEDVATPTTALLPKGVRAVAVDAGYQHLVVLTNAGDVLTFGTDAHGQPLPNKVALRPSWGRVRMVRAGENFTLALTDRGVLLSWGSNTDGQLGLSDQQNRSAPTVVTFPASAGTITDIWAGDRSAVAITSNHEVYSWGDTTFGQLGQGRSDRAQTRPHRITSLDGARMTGVHGGANHAVLIAEHGPAVSLRLTPTGIVTKPGVPVTYHVHAIDAFGTDLGPAQDLALGHVTLRISDGEAVGTTVRATASGPHQVTAQAGRLVGTTTLIVKNGN